MEPRPIEHIGILVEDLEEGIERWSRATGYTFSPIARYRTTRWTDHTDPKPHLHDARISFSLQGQPRIELMEVTGHGTHGRRQLGVHHFGFQNVPSPEQARDELAELGIRTDGCSFDEDGRVLLFFSEKDDLDGVRLELISPLRGPIVADDGSELPRDPETGKADIWASTRPQ